MIKIRSQREPLMPFPASSLEQNMVSNGGYSWLPAAFIPSSSLRATMLVRHKPLTNKPFKHQDFVKVGENVWDVTLDLPDKTVRILPYSEPFNPKDYDEAIYFDPFDPRSQIRDSLEWVLGSAHYALDKVDFHWGQAGDIKIVMDSGGAQIKLGTADYVDPVRVIDVMNQTANAGFSLDVPPALNVDIRNDDMLTAMAHLQKKNNNIFLDRRRDDLALLNVIHGVTQDEQKRWFDTVYSDGFQGYALGIDDAKDVLSGVRGAIMLHEQLKGQDFWLHVFGVSGPKMIPALALFGTKHGRISSDSSTWYEGSRHGKYFKLDQEGGMDRHRLSAQMMSAKDPLYMMRHSQVCSLHNDIRWTPGGMLPCQCKICQTIGNIDAMIGHYYDSTFIILHDLLTLKNFGHHWNTLAQTLPIDEYVKLTRHLMGERSATMVEYIHIGLEHGLDAAERAFRGGPNKAHKLVNKGLVANTTEGRKGNLFANMAAKLEEKTGAPAPAEEPVVMDAAEAAEAAAEEAEEIEMELALNAAQDNEEDGEPESAIEQGNIAQTAPGVAAPAKRQRGNNIAEARVKIDQTNPNFGVCADLTFYAWDELPKDVAEPAMGWPVSNEVARFGNNWAPAFTTKYQTQWRKQVPSRVIWNPDIPEYLEKRIPESCAMAFPQYSNMECILNYVDITKPEDIAELDELVPGLVEWILYTLYWTPNIFRMKSLFEAESGAVNKASNKETAVNNVYMRLRKAMEEERYEDVPFHLDDPAFTKRKATEQTKKFKQEVA